MKMKYQIDQSGKIEQTNKNTVLAAANHQSKAVTLPAKDKRKLQELFRKNNKPQLFIDAVFAVLLYLLIKELNHAGRIEVDTEYPGHTRIIEHMLKQLTNKELTISWALIGKTSKAHDIGYKIYKKKLQLGVVVRFDDVANLAIKIAGGHLNTGLSPANRRSGPANSKTIAQKRRYVKQK